MITTTIEVDEAETGLLLAILNAAEFKGLDTIKKTAVLIDKVTAAHKTLTEARGEKAQSAQDAPKS